MYHKFSVLRVLTLVIPCIAVAWGVYHYYKGLPKLEEDRFHQTTLRRLIGDQFASSKLASAYTDANRDLIADVPLLEQQTVRPEELTFSYIAGSDSKADAEVWNDLTKALSERTGINVTLRGFASSEEQMDAVRNGRLHITAFGTGEVENAVNQSGFVPFACFADSDGTYHYRMNIIVKSDSDIQSVADLKNRHIAFTQPRSNSGCVAALILLIDEQNLQPDQDFHWSISRSHENSIRGVIGGEYEAAAVASDLLDRMMVNKSIDPSAVRVIYESSDYPPGVFGYAHNLAPEVAQAIQDCFLDFQIADSSLETVFSGTGFSKFQSVNYKSDWQPVRDMRVKAFEIVEKLGGSAPK